MKRSIAQFCLFGFVLTPAFHTPIPPGENGPGKFPVACNGLLREILTKSAAYCDRLSGAGLDFVCHEKIREEIYSYVNPYAGTTIIGGERNLDLRPRRYAKVNTWTYDYQMVRQKDQVREHRTLIEEDGVLKEEKNAPLKMARFYSEKAIFGPVGFLAKEWHSLYFYDIIAEDKVEGRKSYIIEVRPKTLLENKPNYGRIWVDKEDGSVLRIDIEQESLPGFEKAREEAKKEGLKPNFKTTHIYGVEKNGLRFPSRTVFEEEYFRIRTRKFKLSKTTIEYGNYRFFTVDVEVKY